MNINIKESSIVRPVQDKSSTVHLWLSNLDLLSGMIRHVPSLYLYKYNDTFSNFFEPKLLKEALKQVLVQFSPVAGRLETDGSGRLEIHCNGKGVLFIEAETDFAFSEISDFTPSEQLFHLVPTVDYSKHVSSYPLLLLQLTKFTCGGVSIGIGWHHILSDATGVVHFLKEWANTARGLPIALPPFLDRTILRSRVSPFHSFLHMEYKLHTLNTSTTATSEPFSLTILKTTPEQINTLKALMPNYTTYEILTAHVWRCVCKARSLPDDQETMLQFSVNCRSRMQPTAPPGYFGNCILHPIVSSLCGELVSEPLVKTVERIHRTIKRVDDEYLRSAIDYLEEEKDSKPNIKTIKGFLGQNFRFISWLRFPFYDVDFGWGKPTYFRAGVPCQGKGNILSSPDDDGILLLPIYLETHHLPFLEKLFYDLVSDTSETAHG